jgi:hypothetical protein
LKNRDFTQNLASQCDHTDTLYRLAMALLASICLNLILLAVDFSIDPRRAELSRIQHLAVRMLSPAEALTERFAKGHGGPQVMALVVLSVLVYAITAWVVLSVPGWWRRRA